LGTHEYCQRWLENNKRRKNFHAGAGRTIRVVEKKMAKMISRMKKSVDDIMDDYGIFKHLTDKDLRLVFSELAQGTK
jgi:hypothetical protein